MATKPLQSAHRYPARRPSRRRSYAWTLLSVVLTAGSSAAGCQDFSRDPTSSGDCSSTDLVCTSCHGDPGASNPAPPVDARGNSDSTAVGTHQAHLGASDWHAPIACDECHVVPTEVAAKGHIGAAPAEITWGSLAGAGGASPAWDHDAVTCAGTYCHGSTLRGAQAGAVLERTPIWTSKDGTYDQCGSACHTNPPGEGHPDSTACQGCHGAVIAQYDPADPGATTWADSSRHVDGTVDLEGFTCTSCHGDSATGSPAPPVGTQGETQPSEPAVGAHSVHLGTSSWHRQVQCTDCHQVPTSTTHSDGVTDLNWGGPANADGASSSYDGATTTCSGTYCHGTTLLGPNAGGNVNREPDWTVVDGTYDECGTTCHTNPPGGSHPPSDACDQCHRAVVSGYDPAVPSATTWASSGLHVNGLVEQEGYHGLVGWTAPGGGTDHHGSNYFLRNQQRDEHNRPCTDCHGSALNGGWSGVSCDNAACHGGSWRSCDFCHGTPSGQYNPPAGVAGESSTGTLAVGRHEAHLQASSTHVAFACTTCHIVPSAGDVAHALQYGPSADLSTPGHHGDVSLSGRATGMTFDVNATQGNPVTARGTCVGACHSDADGGPPNVTPYWAGGSWSTGSCTSCHDYNTINTGSHQNHLQNGVVCDDCHPAASSANHLDGVQDYTGALGGSTTCSNGELRCWGWCHSEQHSGGGGRCW